MRIFHALVAAIAVLGLAAFAAAPQTKIDLGTQTKGTLPTSSLPAAQMTHVCMIIVGADNSAADLVDADLGPQAHQCLIPAASTITQLEVSANAGTPSVKVAVEHAGSDTNITSSALATASAGAFACANGAGSGTCSGGETAGVALATTSIAAGDYIELVSGGVASTGAKRVSVAVTYTTP